MPDDPQVTPEPSTEPVASVEPAQQAQPQYVTRDDFARLESALTALAANMPRSEPAPVAKADLSDEELWSAAQQGNRHAFEMYMERIANKTARNVQGSAQRDSLTRSQLQAL